MLIDRQYGLRSQAKERTLKSYLGLTAVAGSGLRHVGVESFLKLIKVNLC